MKANLWFLVLLSTSVMGQGKFQLEDIYTGFIPISPLPYEGTVLKYDTISKKVVDVIVMSLSNEEIRRVLPDLAVESYLSRTNAQGKIEYGPAGISGGKEDYNVVYDIAKFTTVLLAGPDSANTNDKCRIYGKVGIGIRVRADIRTRKKELNVANLASLGVSASSNKLKGGISFQIFGIEGKDVTNLSPSSLTIDINSVNLALQASSTIKTRMYDTGVYLSPRIFAIKKDGCPAEEAKVKVMELVK